MAQVEGILASPVTRLFRRLSQLLGRWPVALAAVAVIAAVVMLLGLGSSGLWEPQERQVADKAAPPNTAPAAAPPTYSLPGIKNAVTESKSAAAETCLRTAPPDAAARTLTPRATKWGRDTLGDSDTGRRLPFALMGLLTVLATAGIAMRFAGARAGLIAGLVVLSMPLLTLQSRMLTSEIGTACGATLIVYALVALSRLGAAYGTALAAVDAAVAIAALVAGSVLGFYGGGALLGLLVPIGAFAAAGGLGVPMVTSLVRRERFLAHLPALLATCAALALIGVLAYQLYELKTPAPGIFPPAREVFGKAVVSDGCWSWALGGLWRPDDDLRNIFDSSFEQIAYGTFPWGVLAPIAIAALVRSDDLRRRGAGALALAWAGAAWIAGEAFQRKVGFTVFAGFPALAIAVGVWIDSLHRRPASEDREGLPHGMILAGLFFVLAVVVLGKDMQSFADRTTSLLVGSDAIQYPTQTRVLWLPTKLWILILGLIAGLSAGLGLIVWRERATKGFAAWCLATAIAGTVVLAAFWAFVWQPALAQHISSKAMFDTYKELRKPGDQLVIMGDMGQAPAAYADATPEVVADRTAIVAALGRPNRVFAIAPQAELCTLHREIGGKPYFVVDERNTRSLLLSNKLDGTTDKNPLATTILHTEPTQISQKPKGRITFDNKIQLLGWNVPASMKRGSKVTVTMYYKILSPVGGSWKALMHFDGALRFNGDHDPINGRCPTSTWQLGDYIVDSYTLTAGGSAFPAGNYDVYVGFFTGSAPNWKNMAVSEAPGDMRDNADRVKIMSIRLD